MTTPDRRATADARAAGAAVAACTTIITFQLAGKATRDALFLSTFSVAYLPAMEIGAAALSAVVTVGMGRVMLRGPARLIPRLFALSALLLLAEWLLGLQSRQSAAVLVYFHYSALGALLVSGFWAIVNERFDPRTARRAIGRITAGGSIGGLLGGLLSERVGAVLPLTAMLPILAVLHFLAAGLVLGIGHGGTGRPPTDEPREPEEPVLRAGRVLRNSSYLMGLALLVALTSSAEGVLDYVFKARASAASTSGEDLLRFFAAFYTGTALLGILIQVTALRSILAHRGVAQSVSILPAGVSIGAVGAFLVPGVIPVLLARGAELVLRNSVFRAAYELLFTPVAPPEKRVTKLLLDVGAARVGDIAGAALILCALALPGSGAVRILLALTFAISVAALFVARRLHRGYVAALAGSLQRRTSLLPDPIRDDAAALLQTMGAFDLSGIRPRPHVPPDTLAGEPQPAGSQGDASESPLGAAVRRGNVAEIREVLATHPLSDDHIESAIDLLAWDAVSQQAIRALAPVAADHLDVLLRHLLDPEEDFAIRRRLVNVLSPCRTAEAFDGLFQALYDRRFEVRYRSGRALSRMAQEMPDLKIDRERVLRVVEREIGVGRSVWASRQLIDTLEEEASPMETELLRDRADRSLEHLFDLLSLILPRETLRLAFHSLHTDDRYLRGTALEYLETVLPETTWRTLRPLLEPGEGQPRSLRRPDEVLRELLASQQSISLALKKGER